MEVKVWQLQEAKNKFSKLVESAQKYGPQIVTKHGKEAVVILSFQEYQEILSSKGDLVEFFSNSPLRYADIDFSVRSKDMPREAEI